MGHVTWKIMTKMNLQLEAGSSSPKPGTQAPRPQYIEMITVTKVPKSGQIFLKSHSFFLDDSHFSQSHPIIPSSHHPRSLLRSRRHVVRLPCATHRPPRILPEESGRISRRFRALKSGENDQQMIK